MRSETHAQKGYGLAEMRSHSDALHVLRWANCIPVIGLLFEQWYKEEIGDLLRTEKQKAENDEIRMKREEINQGHRKNGTNSLIVRFPVENVQVIYKRDRSKG